MKGSPVIPLTPDEQIAVIKRSLGCLTSGLISLLPGIGIFSAAYVFWIAHRIRSRCPDNLNPAGHYVNFGVWCACGGLLLTFVIVGLFLAATINEGHSDSCAHYVDE